MSSPSVVWKQQSPDATRNKLVSTNIHLITIDKNYLRILAWSFASSSVKIGTAFDLCKVPMPFILSPV
jgi:hypothetical protein